jgi:hypothetical protein
MKNYIKIFSLSIVMLILHSCYITKSITIVDANKYDLDFKNNDIINYELGFCSKEIISNITDIKGKALRELKREALKGGLDTIYVDLKTNFGDKNFENDKKNYRGYAESNYIGMCYWGLSYSKKFNKKYLKRLKKKEKELQD